MADWNSNLQVTARITNDAVNPLDTTRRKYAYVIRPKYLRTATGQSRTLWSVFLQKPFRKKVKMLRKWILESIANNPKTRGGR